MEPQQSAVTLVVESFKNIDFQRRYDAFLRHPYNYFCYTPYFSNISSTRRSRRARAFQEHSDMSTGCREGSDFMCILYE